MLNPGLSPEWHLLKKNVSHGQSSRYAHGAGPSGLLAEIQLLSMDTGFRRYDKTMKNYGLSKRYSAQPLLNLSSDLNGRGLND
tara:strand:- start:5012 stop:5260 length:249 start_codon:yes stop_codon:yes gene_type:complete